MRTQLKLNRTNPWDLLIERLLAYKGVHTHIQTFDSPSRAVFQDREIHLTDHLTMIDYLDERYPHPQLLPTDIVKRNNLRNILRTLIHYEHEDTSRWIETQINKSPHPQPQSPPTLMDFAIARFIPKHSPHYATWSHLQ